MIEFQYNDLFNVVMNDFPGTQLPDSYPNPENPTIPMPLNPNPDVPGTDAPEVVPGTNVQPQNPGEDPSEAESS